MCYKLYVTLLMIPFESMKIYEDMFYLSDEKYRDFVTLFSSEDGRVPCLRSCSIGGAMFM